MIKMKFREISGVRIVMGTQENENGNGTETRTCERSQYVSFIEKDQ